jgi:YHS domain-containing protein
MRQKRKEFLTIIPRIGTVLFAFWTSLVPVEAASIVTTIVSNPLTGVAMDGYDPISFFVDAEPAQGVADFEFDWGGVPWYFANGANRDAFARNPEVYAPQWGGHCPSSLARGYLSDGKPQIWLVRDGRLYLFHSDANRDAFLDSPTATLAQAQANWTVLVKGLNGPEPGMMPQAAKEP